MIFEFICLKKIEVNLEKGKKIGIIGKSGSGKSTILKLLSGDIFSDKISMLLKSHDEDPFPYHYSRDIYASFSNKVKQNLITIKYI